MAELPVIVAPKDRVWCGGVEGRTHKRSAGGLCEACNDYRPDWCWEQPTLATAFDDGRRYGIAKTREDIAKWLERQGCEEWAKEVREIKNIRVDPARGAGVVGSMGYTTNFEGQFNLDKPLTQEHAAYLTAFSESRRMARDAEKAEKLSDPVREAVSLPIGKEAGYFVGGGGLAGQEHDDSIIDYNEAPKGQPGLWCQWVPTEDLQGIEWNGGEKFYDYIEWIQYLIYNFLGTWGYVVSGEVSWEGESSDDLGKIIIVNNEVTTKAGRVVYE